MLLVLAILALLGSIGIGILIGFANMLGNSPGESFSQWPSLIGFAIALLFFAGWWWQP